MAMDTPGTWFSVPSWSRQEMMIGVAFWCLGVLNNSPFVVMNAVAIDIAVGGVALVYLANIAPALVVAFTIPFWADLVEYRSRAFIASTLMAMAFVTVAFGSTLEVKLLGVAAASFQGGLGEATMLGLAAKFHPFSRTALAAWSSGTGFAGIFGYSSVVFLHQFLGLSLRMTLLIALFLPVAYLIIFLVNLDRAPSQIDISLTEPSEPRDGGNNYGTDQTKFHQKIKFSFHERIVFVLQLWPFLVPLIVVYFAEYAMQSGTWAVIGFPIQDAHARFQFYVLANWSYQVGVFISRSSGTLMQASIEMLWILPLVQMCLLSFFSVDVIFEMWWNWHLLWPCFLTGLIGGFVYVNALTLISENFHRLSEREFALSVANIGCCVGILLSNIAGLVLQGCLFKYHDLPNPTFHC
eukprot:TRINITY_DN71362_c0_g1_i1.p1 TRINITY_DN71362_c0_g1~~TRINITY_DN71362_c0_g1_i1.p1  ORF type:complete len:409 (+),score=50.01 TRINITY_DN71362_c0_g1_i1:30-1256(+)